MLTIAHSGFSAPSAQRIAEQGDVTLVRSSTQQVDVNWGRASANAALNPDTSVSTNKRVMREKFAAASVPMPSLFPGPDSPDRLEAVHEALVGGGVIIGRPDRHSKGRGMWVITDVPTLTKALRGTRRKAAATHFMERVEAEREYRCHIFQGKSIRISRKDFADDGKTWLAVKPGDIRLRTVREAAAAAVAALGLDFGAVDVLASGARNEEVWVLEVNSAPGLGGTMPRVYYQAFEQWKAAQDD